LVLALLLAAVAVGLGNFAASIGIGLSDATRATRVRVALVFGVFEAGMPLVGLLAGRSVAQALGNVSGYVGGTLLVGIGAWQLIQAFRARNGGIAPPTSTRRLLITGFALSMDNLVVGFSLGVQHTSLLDAVVVFAAVSVCLSLLGLEVGRRLGAVLEIGAGYLAGAILMAVGLIVAVG
jgi:putative Mn2+ efflux pump MntP